MNRPPQTLLFDLIEAPAGAPFAGLCVVSDGERLCAADFAGHEARMHRLLERRYGAFRLVRCADPCGASTRMRAYLRGDMDAFEGLEVRTGGTAFQAAAWLALRSIPAGATATYGEQAARLGRPAAVRAVGAANAQNPLAIVLPCHRVVGADGALTGYAGGLAAKQWLLAHEARGLLR